MRSYLLCSLLILFVLFQACRGEDDSSKPNPYAAKFIAELNPTGSFISDVAKIRTTLSDSLEEDLNKKNERFLGLESLKNGYDSIQLRIAYSCNLGTPIFLIILKNKNKRWTAEISQIIFPSTWRNWGDSIGRKTYFNSPRSGWIDFINKLFDLKILTLPTDDSIPNFKYEGVMDGCSAEIELATKNVYRFYTYNNPDLYKYWQTKNVLRILKLINDEFEVRKKFHPKHLWPDDFLE